MPKKVTKKGSRFKWPESGIAAQSRRFFLPGALAAITRAFCRRLVIFSPRRLRYKSYPSEKLKGRVSGPLAHDEFLQYRIATALVGVSTNQKNLSKIMCLQSKLVHPCHINLAEGH